MRKEFCEEGILPGRNFVRKARKEFCQEAGSARHNFCKEGNLSGRNSVRQEFCKEGNLSGRNSVRKQALPGNGPGKTLPGIVLCQEGGVSFGVVCDVVVFFWAGRVSFRGREGGMGVSQLWSCV